MLPEFGLSVSQAARETGVARRALRRPLAGAVGVTPEMAVRLGRPSGVPAGHRLGRQQAYNLRHAEHAMADVVRRIPARVLPGPLRREIGEAPRG